MHKPVGPSINLQGVPIQPNPVAYCVLEFAARDPYEPPIFRLTYFDLTAFASWNRVVLSAPFARANIYSELCDYRPQSTIPIKYTDASRRECLDASVCTNIQIPGVKF